MTPEEQALPRFRRAPLAVAAAAAALLVAGALVMRMQIRDASDAVVRGQADAFASAAREVWRAGGALDDERLARFLEEQRDAGLRYAAACDARRGDDPAAAPPSCFARAGDALGASLDIGRPAPVGDRFRVVRPLPTGDQRRTLAVLEFEPRVARELEADARNVLLLAFATAACVLALALALTRAWTATTRLLADLAASRRLAALGEMSAVLAHEIKNPLASLKGHAQLLEEQLEPDSKARKKAALVVGEAARLERLTQELLSFVRGGDVQKSEVDARDLVSAVVAEAGGDGVRVTVADDARVLFVDEALLRQALGNIVRNAVQAQPAAAPPAIEVTRDGGAGVVVIAVRDYGPGVDAADLPHVFEPFFTRRARGTGLGLAVARRIIEQHGGSIAVANTKDGGGAVFRVRLPAPARAGPG